MNTWNYVCGMLMYYISEFALNVLMWEFLFQGYRWWFADTCPFRDPVGCFFGFEVTTGVSPMPSILHTVSGKVGYVGAQLCLLNWPTKYVNIFVRWKLAGDDLLTHLFYFFICREADESRLREVCENFLGPPLGMLGSASSTEPKNPSWDPDVLVSLSFTHHVHTRSIIFLDNH